MTALAWVAVVLLLVVLVLAVAVPLFAADRGA